MEFLNIRGKKNHKDCSLSSEIQTSSKQKHNHALSFQLRLERQSNIFLNLKIYFESFFN